MLLLKIHRYGYRSAVAYILRRFIQVTRVFIYRYVFSDNRPWLDNVMLIQPVRFVGRGAIKLHGVTVGLWSSPDLFSGATYIEARNETASVQIGNGSVLNNGSVIIADKGEIKIGARCLIGPGFFVVDSDFHGLEIENRQNNNYFCRDVIIGDDVFIGSHVKIMKGVRIGDGSVIGTGSVVVSDVAPMSIYAGAPAKFIRKI